MTTRRYASNTRSAFPDVDLGGGSGAGSGAGSHGGGDLGSAGGVQFPDVFQRGNNREEQKGEDLEGVSGGVSTEENVPSADVTVHVQAWLAEDGVEGESSADVDTTNGSKKKPSASMAGEGEAAAGGSGSKAKIASRSSSRTATTGSEMHIAREGINSTSSGSLSQSVKPGLSRRSEFPLVPSKAALLVIDVQDYLSTPSFHDESSEGDGTSDGDAYLFGEALPRAITNIQSLIQAVRSIRDANDTPPIKAGCEVIFTYLQALTDDSRDVSLDYKLSGPSLASLPGPSSPATFQAAFYDGDATALAAPSPTNGKGDILIPKTSCSVFNSTNIHYVLRNLHVEQLILCGQLTNQCVESAAKDAADLGYFVTVVDDACAAKSRNDHREGLHGVEDFSRIVSTSQVLSELSTAMVAMDELDITEDMAPPEPTDPVTKPAPKKTKKKKSKTSSLVGTLATATMPLPISLPNSFDPALGKSVELGTGAALAILRSLRSAGIKFLRFGAVDACSIVRCKNAPINRILSDIVHSKDHVAKPSKKLPPTSPLDDLVCLPEVTMAGLPSYADIVIPSSGFDASNLLALRPDLSTLRILPYASNTAFVLGTVHDPCTGELSPICSRGLLSRVLEMARTAYGLAFTVGAELEFVLFDESTGKQVDEALVFEPNVLNQQDAFLSDLYDQLEAQDIPVEMVHSESAAGQVEVVLARQDDPMDIADNAVVARETVRAVAKKYKMRALFLPKLNDEEPGNGMHVHMSMRDLRSVSPNRNIFPRSDDEKEDGGDDEDDSRRVMSSIGASFVEGILRHLPALVAITTPSDNSFRRVAPGYWTGSDVSWCVENKESPLRVCVDSKSGKATNLELKLFDSLSNIYLGLATVLSAGLHGIVGGWQLRPSEKSSDYLPEPLPATYADSIECLKNDEFIMEVLGEELSRGFLAIKENEIENSKDTELEDVVATALRKS